MSELTEIVCDNMAEMGVGNVSGISDSQDIPLIVRIPVYSVNCIGILIATHNL